MGQRRIQISASIGSNFGANQQADFHRAGPSRKTENLGNWKSDILTGHPTRQDFRILGFTRPLMHENLAG